MSQKLIRSPKFAGALFIAGGVMWFAAAWLGDQPIFYGIGAMFVLLGIANLARARKAGDA